MTSNWRRCYTLAMVAVGLLACSGAEDEVLFEYRGIWVVEGERCQGSAVTRLVEVASTEDAGGLEARYRRSDACVEKDDIFWEGELAESGAVRLDGVSAEVVQDGLERLHIEASEGRLTMLRVYPETGPPALPELDDVSLSGRWLMEGYPCEEGLVPQLVQVSHVSNILAVSKILGDACIEGGVRFIEGTLSGLRVEAEVYLEPPDPWGETETFDTTGRVRVPEYFRLDVLGVAVSFRRVLGE